MPSSRTNNCKHPSFGTIFHDGVKTTHEHIVSCLEAFLRYESHAATDKAYEVSDDGNAVVATLPYEIAEEKVAAINGCSDMTGNVLKVTMEMST